MALSALLGSMSAVQLDKTENQRPIWYKPDPCDNLRPEHRKGRCIDDSKCAKAKRSRNSDCDSCEDVELDAEMMDTGLLGIDGYAFETE